MKLFKLFLGTLLVTFLSVSITLAQESSDKPVEITQKAIATINIQDTKIIFIYILN
jgi:hypothetical protein